MGYRIKKTEQEWREILGDDAYRILRQKGTERPFSGEYNDHYDYGVYVCRACNHQLFLSESKFSSGCGWPSFDSELPDAKVERKRDIGFGMIRTEILCSQCGGHLGHVFNDGPTDTGERYCVNSLSISFKPLENE